MSEAVIASDQRERGNLAFWRCKSGRWRELQRDCNEIAASPAAPRNDGAIDSAKSIHAIALLSVAPPGSATAIQDKLAAFRCRAVPCICPALPE